MADDHNRKPYKTAYGDITTDLVDETGGDNCIDVVGDSLTIDTGEGEDRVSDRQIVVSTRYSDGKTVKYYNQEIGMNNSDLSTGKGDDRVTLLGSHLSRVDTGEGNDEVYIGDGSTSLDVSTGAGKDTLEFSYSLLRDRQDQRDHRVDLGTDNDTVELDGSYRKRDYGEVDGGEGRDLIKLEDPNGSTFGQETDKDGNSVLVINGTRYKGFEGLMLQYSDEATNPTQSYRLPLSAEKLEELNNPDKVK